MVESVSDPFQAFSHLSIFSVNGKVSVNVQINEGSKQSHGLKHRLTNSAFNCSCFLRLTAVTQANVQYREKT